MVTYPFLGDSLAQNEVKSLNSGGSSSSFVRNIATWPEETAQ